MAVYKSVQRLSTSDAAYLAGLIDGEGTITLTRRNKNAERCLVLSIVSTEIELVRYPRTVTGVGQIISRKAFRINHSRSWTYVVSGRQALDVISQTLPHLKSYKRLRADLAIKDYVRLTPRNGRYSAEQKEAREKFINTFFSIQATENGPRSRAISM